MEFFGMGLFVFLHVDWNVFLSKNQGEIKDGPYNEQNTWYGQYDIYYG